jgi:threonine synthase
MLSPLEVTYDYDSLKKRLDAKTWLAAHSIWRYAELLPLPEDFTPVSAVGGTPLVASRKLASLWGIKNVYFKNDAVCFPSLSFKDRVVGTALVAARRFGFETVGCSSTGNLANAVAAQAAQQGFDACVFIPADLEPAKVLNTAVYGARIVRINGNYDHVNRLCAQVADRFQWGLVNVNLRPTIRKVQKRTGTKSRSSLADLTT